MNFPSPTDVSNAIPWELEKWQDKVKHISVGMFTCKTWETSMTPIQCSSNSAILQDSPLHTGAFYFNTLSVRLSKILWPCWSQESYDNEATLEIQSDPSSKEHQCIHAVSMVYPWGPHTTDPRPLWRAQLASNPPGSLGRSSQAGTCAEGDENW